MMTIGSIVEIKLAYEMDTGRRTGHDEIAGCEGQILQLLRGGEALVQIRGMENVYVHMDRLKFIR